MLPVSSQTTKKSVVHSILSKQVDGIVEQILDEKNEVAESGLLAGTAGIVLLFAYLYKARPQKKYLTSIFKYLDKLNDSLSGDALNYNMSMGVAGIAFVYQHLRNTGFLDAGEDINLAEFDSFIDRCSNNEFRDGNWDPLHGMTGAGIYFLERNNETFEKNTWRISWITWLI